MSYFDKTIDEKLTQADEYFGEENSIRHYDWEVNSTSEKKAGLNQAEREINLFCGANFEEVYGSEDFPISGFENFRPDYAMFEQALFILENTARRKTGTGGAMDIESEQYQEEERLHGVGLCPIAGRFLDLNGIQIDRG